MFLAFHKILEIFYNFKVRLVLFKNRSHLTLSQICQRFQLNTKENLKNMKIHDILINLQIIKIKKYMYPSIHKILYQYPSINKIIFIFLGNPVFKQEKKKTKIKKR